MPLERLTNCSTGLGIPDSNGVVVGSGDDVLAIRRVSNTPDQAIMPFRRLADCSTSLGIPSSNGGVVGCRDDVPPIGRVSNGQHQAFMPLERLANCSTVLAFQIRMVWSEDLEMMWQPSGE